MERRTFTTRDVNVADAERLVSVVAGAAAGTYGLIRRAPAGLALAVAGGMLLYRGLSGHCHVYQALGIDRAPDRRSWGNLGVKVERDVRVDDSADTLYRFWRDLRNVPWVMPHVESVTVISDTRSHWVLKAPAGLRLEWDAEIINERPGELIAWCTVGPTSVDHAGSVRFEPVANGPGTVVRVSLQYAPPGGEIGHALASLLGQDAGRQIDEGLASFKVAMERARIGTGATW